MKNGIQKTAMIMAIMAIMAVSATTLWAVTDYSAMSNEELSTVRGTLQSSSQEDRNAFRTEWRQRVPKMTPEDQQQYMGHSSCRSASGTGKHHGNGHGSGHGKHHGMGSKSQ